MQLLPRNTNLGWTPWAWTIYLVPFVMTPLFSSRFDTPSGWALFVGTTLFFLPVYLRSYWADGLELLLIAALTTLLGLALWPISYAAGAFFIYAAGMMGQIEPPRRAFVAVGSIAALVLLQALLLDRPWVHASWPFIFTLLVGSLNIHFAQVNRSNARLRLAHGEIEHLAKVAERERIARDLHDVVGHTLSLVVLKSELAAKLADRDPERAREEIRDVERIAREALAEVRAAVTGYRAGGIDSEVKLARSTLATAGMTVETEVPPGLHVPAAQEAVLCLALREAVTNIVRHSGAHHCRITFTSSDENCTMTVQDDGRGGNHPTGSGLRGMNERVEALGGTVTRDGRQGTMLTVVLPLVTRREERTA